MRLLRRLFLILAFATPMALTPMTARADDPTVRMVVCAFRMGHSWQPVVPAGSPMTLVIVNTMATRGNLEDFVRAATVTFTLDGQTVPATVSAPIPTPNASGEDFWHAVWMFSTIAPAAGHTVRWTVAGTLSHPVVDHSLQEFGQAGPGQPGMIPAGMFWDPALFYCDITGT